MNYRQILGWLRENDARKLRELWQRADSVRRRYVGDEVHLRGLIEISNYCVRQCGYCGLRAGNAKIERYRMSFDEIMECAGEAQRYGYGTVVLQAGEDYGIETGFLTRIIQQIKRETTLAVTLSMGERPLEDLEEWRHAGADRYLLRFETSDRQLYRIIHPRSPEKRGQVREKRGQVYTFDINALPTMTHHDEIREDCLDDPKGTAYVKCVDLTPYRHERIEMLRSLKKLGYEIGGGVMVGIPGQTIESLARDIEVFRELDLDMIGIGPYIAHPETPLGRGEWVRSIAPEDQTPATEEMTCRMIALARIVCPQANIPATTALATIGSNGRELGLLRGANVVMPNLTPARYRAKYEIYPGKVCITETAADCHLCLLNRIRSIGRRPGTGPGSRLQQIREQHSYEAMGL